MTVVKPVVLLLAAVSLLAACETEPRETYPVSGEQCAPTDPVQTLDAADCFVPTGIS